MIKKLLILLLFASPVMAQDWGGTVYQDPDSINCNSMLEVLPDANTGADVAMTWQDNSSFQRSVLVGFANDPHDGAKTQDSARIYIYWTTGGPGATNDTLVVYGYVILRNWGEGDKSFSDADAGESSWNAAIEGTQDWTTGGAQSDGNDHEATAACSLFFVGNHADAGDTVVVSAKIAGTHLTQDFFDNGLLLEWKWDNFTPAIWNATSDDAPVANQRPYISGYESSAAAPIQFGIGVTIGIDTKVGQ